MLIRSKWQIDFFPFRLAYHLIDRYENIGASVNAFELPETVAQTAHHVLHVDALVEMNRAADRSRSTVCFLVSSLN